MTSAFDDLKLAQMSRFIIKFQVENAEAGKPRSSAHVRYAWLDRNKKQLLCLSLFQRHWRRGACKRRRGGHDFSSLPWTQTVNDRNADTVTLAHVSKIPCLNGLNTFFVKHSVAGALKHLYMGDAPIHAQPHLK